VTIFADRLLNLTEKPQHALEAGAPMSDEDGARLRTGIENRRA